MDTGVTIVVVYATLTEVAYREGVDVGMNRVAPPRASTDDEDLQEYRQGLAEAEQKSQIEFDKTVLTLSGGALGVSFAFIKQFVGPGRGEDLLFMLAAWMCWVLSVSSVLLSHFLSTRALRRAIAQVDAGTIRNQRPGGFDDRLLVILNIASGVLFLAGLVFAGFFVYTNL